MGILKIRKTTEQFISESITVHGDKYDYSLVNYETSRIKVRIICHEHGEFMQSPLNHLHNHGCPACSKCKRTTIHDFLSRARTVHGDRYDYDRVDYRSVDGKISIICPDHGIFEQVAFDHMKGRGCAKCGAAAAVKKRTTTLEKFVIEARELHGEKFDYSRVQYSNSVTPIEIICPDHGSFFQSPQDHKTRYGCAACSGLSRITGLKFLTRARRVHGDLYEYNEDSFKSYSLPVEITCKTHGVFWQVPKDHINKGCGCPACARERMSSKEEMEIADWLRSIGQEVLPNDRTMLDGFELDAYLPEHRLAVEYNGSYWHNDERMKHPRIHEIKAIKAHNANIRLITVWDFDWKKKNELVKRHILHALGLSHGTKTNARQCTTMSISFDCAKKFYTSTHIQGAPWRALAHYGLFHNGEIVACMSFGQGNSRRGKTGCNEWELLRFSTDGIVRGGASKLFKHFFTEHNPDSVWSFSDRQHFSGGLYETLGFELDGDVPADYRVVHQGKGLVWHKSAWKRKNIQSRLNELGINTLYDAETDERTEREMQRLAGTLRIMDAGKLRWKWEKSAQ